MEEVNSNLIFLILLSIFVVYIIMVGFKQTKENERIALFQFGKFVKIVGPGLNFFIPNQAKQMQRVFLGQEGEYLGNGVAKINDSIFPVKGESLDCGDIVKIISFDNANINVKAIVIKKDVICPHCKQSFTLN